MTRARLVFADWLQENGDEARAELIRVQCALEGAAASDPANAARHRRVEELLNANWDRWLPGSRPGCDAIGSTTPSFAAIPSVRTTATGS
jgi:hypothetical protein